MFLQIYIIQHAHFVPLSTFRLFYLLHIVAVKSSFKIHPLPSLLKAQTGCIHNVCLLLLLGIVPPAPVQPSAWLWHYFCSCTSTLR